MGHLLHFVETQFLNESNRQLSSATIDTAPRHAQSLTKDQDQCKLPPRFKRAFPLRLFRDSCHVVVVCVPACFHLTDGASQSWLTFEHRLVQLFRILVRILETRTMWRGCHDAVGGRGVVECDDAGLLRRAHKPRRTDLLRWLNTQGVPRQDRQEQTSSNQGLAAKSDRPGRWDSVELMRVVYKHRVLSSSGGTRWQRQREGAANLWKIVRFQSNSRFLS